MDGKLEVRDVRVLKGVIMRIGGVGVGVIWVFELVCCEGVVGLVGVLLM